MSITQNPLVISCYVRGRPLPDVTWYKDDVAIGDQGGLYYVRTIQQPIDTYSYNVTSSLLFQGQPIRTLHASHVVTSLTFFKKMNYDSMATCLFYHLYLQYSTTFYIKSFNIFYPSTGSMREPSQTPLWIAMQFSPFTTY